MIDYHVKSFPRIPRGCDRNTEEAVMTLLGMVIWLLIMAGCVYCVLGESSRVWISYPDRSSILIHGRQNLAEHTAMINDRMIVESVGGR